jgi:hypothetical protein
MSFAIDITNDIAKKPDLSRDLATEYFETGLIKEREV